MAKIIYEIKDKIIDMTPVYTAIETDSLVEIMIALETALRPVADHRNIGISVLASEIKNTKKLPSEQEIEETLGTVSKERLRACIDRHEANTVVSKNVSKCPTCGSTKLTKQSVMSRGISGFLFGRHSVEGRAQFLCDNCGYQW